jgi:preprotein translocase subunit SecG
MTATLLVIHILLAIALVGVILMQRTSSDGGGLTGGSSSMGGLMTVRGTANLLTRTTSFLATGFIITSILLTILGGTATRARSITEDVKPAAAETPMPTENPLVPGADKGVLDKAGEKEAPKQSVPEQSTPAVPLSQ